MKDLSCEIFWVYRLCFGRLPCSCCMFQKRLRVSCVEEVGNNDVNFRDSGRECSLEFGVTVCKLRSRNFKTRIGSDYYNV